MVGKVIVISLFLLLLNRLQDALDGGVYVFSVIVSAIIIYFAHDRFGPLITSVVEILAVGLILTLFGGKVDDQIAQSEESIVITHTPKPEVTLPQVISKEFILTVQDVNHYADPIKERKEIIRNSKILEFLLSEDIENGIDDLAELLAPTDNFSSYQDTLQSEITLDCYDTDTDEQCKYKFADEISSKEQELRQELISRNESAMSKNSEILDQAKIKVDEIDLHYKKCQHTIAKNPKINLDNTEMIIDLKIDCFIKGGFENEIVALSKRSNDLKQAIEWVKDNPNLWYLYFDEFKLDEVPEFEDEAFDEESEK